MRYEQKSFILQRIRPRTIWNIMWFISYMHQLVQWDHFIACMLFRLQGIILQFRTRKSWTTGTNRDFNGSSPTNSSSLWGIWKCLKPLGWWLVNYLSVTVAASNIVGVVFFWLKITLEGSLSLCILNEKLAGHLGKFSPTNKLPKFMALSLITRDPR